MIFHSHASKTHFHKKGFALSLILKARVFRTRKWPIHQTFRKGKKVVPFAALIQYCP